MRPVLFFFFISLGLELSDTKVYEPYIQALLGTASHYCEAVVLKSPSGTALGQCSQAVVAGGRASRRAGGEGSPQSAGRSTANSYGARPVY